MGDHQLILIHPSRRGDMGIKVPADACPLFLREECVIVDIKPKELIARGMPQCPSPNEHTPESKTFTCVILLSLLALQRLIYPMNGIGFLQQIVDGD